MGKLITSTPGLAWAVEGNKNNKQQRLSLIRMKKITLFPSDFPVYQCMNFFYSVPAWPFFK
ncbi:hypothetical protein GCM10011409_41230 [Lentibacillus populi]|uniref:Uncharacterized protein n=1 Tax=Lentibacillus populi TaxID=1827502 RepID=A0A9W5X7E0_9BACI|nr:hypothetical protein GCM10011409_41230 [Lentibacillus populi]